jgi:predicted nucleotidyltransferase
MIKTMDLAAIIHRIANHLDPEKIILFGSYARGDATEQSDVDLMVVARTNLPQRDRFRSIRRLLADFPAAFDVYLKTPEEFQRWQSVVNHVVYYADKYGKIVYERNSARSGSPVVVTSESRLGNSKNPLIPLR